MSQEITKFYKTVGILFVLVAIVLSGGIFYFNLAKATIIITPSAETSKAEFIIDIREFPFEPQELGENEVDGKIFEIVKEGEKSFPATENKDVITDSVGQVTIINNYSKDQQLVATTRLLSSDGVLLRLKDEVKVAKGQQAIVEVYPDKPEEFTSLDPTKFTIPGLWSGIQEHIYAESTQKLAKGGYKVKIVGQGDIDTAAKNYEDELYNQALEEVNSQLSVTEKLFTKVFQREVVLGSADSQVGEEKAQFNYNMKLKVIFVVFDEKKLINAVEKRLEEELPPNKQLIGLDTSSLIYNLEKVDVIEKIANLKVQAAGLAAIAEKSEIFDKFDLLGLTENEVKEYFEKYNEIETVQVKYTPSWLRKMPNSANRIEVMVK
ncbi:hypothetical protein KKA15_04915 [Patescibacteria group bacterium]|nr:hypothetical protein [Patescibacteria group bacterium]